jgi:hypothetical protein
MWVRFWGVWNGFGPTAASPDSSSPLFFLSAIRSPPAPCLYVSSAGEIDWIGGGLQKRIRTLYEGLDRRLGG